MMTDYGNMAPIPSGPPSNIPLPLPDMSRPPPGFPPPGFMQQNVGMHPPSLMSLNVKPPMEMDLMPSMPYYDLPAGLMAPLVKVGIAITIFICHLMTEIIFFQ
jgi:calcium homeostasis endoplasmic reticulum protein